MFMLRAAGALLIAYALFNVALGLNRGEPTWLLAAVLLAVGGLSLLMPRPWSRPIVLAAAAGAAGIGAVGQIHAAGAAGASLGAAVTAWAIWSSLWLVAAWIGVRYLPPPPDSAQP